MKRRVRTLLAFIVHPRGSLAAHGRTLTRAVAFVAFAAAAGLLTSSDASTAGDAVTYHAGWNIAGAPEGTRYAGGSGPIYTLQPGDSGYETFAAGTPAVSGQGYWVYFGTARTVQLTEGVPFTSSVLPPGQWVLVGNPSGTHTSPATGADALFTFDPGRGYRAAASLLPGQGAWAYSQNGGMLSIGFPLDVTGDGDPSNSDIPAGPIGALDADGCRTGNVLAGVYHPARLQVLSPCTTATGIVAALRVEADGDFHANILLDRGQESLVNARNLTIQKGALVIEVIPADQSNVPPPQIGSRVSITGAWVLDRDHGWQELHPVWSITPLPR
jgi:hypothetical protein